MTKNPPHFYGRRQGRPLQKNRLKLMETLFPGVSLEEDLLEKKILDLQSLFPQKVEEIELEIGFGGGEHLAFQASQNPHGGFIGVEAYANGVSSLIRHMHEQALENIRIYQGDVRLLLPKLPPHSLSRIFILFPDPWPKRRHFKRRLISKESLQLFHRLLIKSQGTLRIASDEPSYIQWIIEHFETSSLFSMPPGVLQDWQEPFKDWFPTRYEQKAIQAGRQPVYMEFKPL